MDIVKVIYIVIQNTTTCDLTLSQSLFIERHDSTRRKSLQYAKIFIAANEDN